MTHATAAVIRPAADITFEVGATPSTAAEVVQILSVLAVMLFVALLQAVM